MIQLLLIILLIICLIPLLVSKCREGRMDLFTPAGLFCAGFAFSYLAKAWMIFADEDYVTYPENYVPSDDIFIIALILSIIGITSFLIGYYFSNRALTWAVPEITLPANADSVILTSIPIVLGLVSILALVAFNIGTIDFSSLLSLFITLRDSLMSSWNNFPIFFHFPVYSGLFFMVYYHLSKNRPEKHPFFVAFMMAACLFVNIILGSRALTFSFVISLLLYRHWYIKPLGFKKQISILIVVGILASILGIFQKFDQREGLKALTYPFPKNVLYRLSTTYEQFENLHAVVRVQPELLYGRSIAEDWFFTYVPRRLWPGKPLDFGFIRAQNILFEHYWDSGDRTTTYPIGMLAELYVNFGTIGIIVGMLLLGMLIKALEIKATNLGTAYPAILCFIIAATVSALRTYGTFVMMVYLGIFYVFFISLSAKALSLKKYLVTKQNAAQSHYRAD